MESLRSSYVPEQFYQERLNYYKAKIQASRKRLKRMAFLRLLVFLATVVMAVIATRWSLSGVIIISICGITAFLITVIYYISKQKQLRRYESLADINENELKALDGDCSVFEDGHEFDWPDHPYTDDLDIFGPKSLFQFFNRSATFLGKVRLAEWFSQPMLNSGDIVTRQGAVSEMAAKPLPRQEFLATGYQVREQPGDKDDLLRWVNEPAEFTGKVFFFFLYFIPVLTLVILVLSFTSVIPASLVLLYIAVPFGFVGRKLKSINRKYAILSGKAELMKKYSGLFALLEREKFTSGMMNDLQAALHGKSRLPSEATKDLSAILDAFDARNNVLAGFLLNFLFLWDLFQVVRTERWQARYREELPRWLEVLAETDAVCSLGNFHFNHPDSIFPAISGNEIRLEATALGHPLIPPASRVSNPAYILCRRHFSIVSGANMAGKSTYLRTVGINLVLAMAGSAVTAEKMEFRPAGLVTSIRTKDSLQKNESYFYAELKRLKFIIERLEKGEELVILLDEILKGTNSKDKQSGSFALLEKLLRYDASGLIATHDLALGELAHVYPGEIVNKSFEVIIENDLLVFDYKLKDGVARQMNATFLMRKMGITD